MGREEFRKSTKWGIQLTFWYFKSESPTRASIDPCCPEFNGRNRSFCDEGYGILSLGNCRDGNKKRHLFRSSKPELANALKFIGDMPPTETGFRLNSPFLKSAHPPRSGWLDELGRLKGDRPIYLDVALKRASVVNFQNWPFDPSASSWARMYSRICSSSNPTVETAYPRAQRCSPLKLRSLPPNCRATATALFPLRNSITEATGCFGGIAIHI